MLTQTRLKELLHYDPLTGLFTWMANRGGGVKAGDIAGCEHPDGYIIISVDDQKYRAHRLAWLYMTGKWPEKGLDHKNRVPCDNKFLNLREATQIENMQNQRLSCRSKSGFTGVTWDKSRNKWRATIALSGKSAHVGYFDTKEGAHSAYSDTKKKLHTFHPEIVT